MAMVNMKMDPEEAKEQVTPEVGDAPQYPYGLELRLDDKSLAKLGMTSPPAVGTEMSITARVVVSSASQYQTQGGEAEASSCWQITDMEASSVSAKGDKAQALYGKPAAGAVTSDSTS